MPAPNRPLTAASARHPQTGAALRAAEGAPTCNVRLLLPQPGGSEEVLAAAGDGRLLVLSGEACSVAASAALPGTPAAAAEAACDDGLHVPPAAQAVSAAAAAAAALEPGASSGVGPEFIVEAGYRGHKCAGWVHGP